MRRSNTLTIMIATIALLGALQRAAAQTGACCEDATGICTQDVVMADCMSLGSRYADNGTCGEFSPACGMGVCCTFTGCTESTYLSCLFSPDGTFWWPAAVCSEFDCSDCDNNGVPDSIDIELDPSLDCNQNGLLDRCEIDAASAAPGGPFFCITGDCATDCNNNGILDECEIYEYTSAPGGPYYCTTGCDPDCNNNGIPDACDIDAGDPDGDGMVSDDVLDPIGVPDECRRWTGTVNDLWSEPGNWLPATVPNNTPDEHFSVVIDGSIDAPSANVEGDADVTVSTLVLRDGSVLTLTQGDLTLDGRNGIVDEGELVIPDNRAMFANMSFRIRANGGVIRLEGETARIQSADTAMISNEIEIVGRGEITANLRNANVGTVTANDPGPSNAGTLVLAGPVTLNNGNLVARERGSLLIKTDVSEEFGAMSSLSAIGGDITVGDGGDTGDDPEVVDGCGPIILRPTDLTAFTLDRGELRNFTTWEIGDNTLTLPNQKATFVVRNNSVGIVSGPVNVRGNGTLGVDTSRVEATEFFLDAGAEFSATNSAILTARGDFIIAGNDETLFGFATGTTLAFEGGTGTCGSVEWDRTLEAASRNFGPGLNDGGYDNNFDFGRLRIEANARVELVDNFDNGNRPLDGAEAVYCDELMMEPGARLFLNGIALFVGGQQVMAGRYGTMAEIYEREACCLPDSTCIMEISECCMLDLAGDPRGPGSQCISATGDCPPIGACCLPDDICLNMTEPVCIAQSGVFNGPDSDCSNLDCTPDQPSPLPIGACCISDGSCNDTTEEDCTNGGAVFLGNFTRCATADCSLPGPAPQTGPTGACCLADRTCMDLISSDCTTINGEFLGTNNDCTTVNCDIGDPAPPDTVPDANVLDALFCSLFRQSLCGIPGCAPCGLLSLMVTMIGIRRMRRRGCRSER